ncbi:MAG TPA: hypothetical protein VN515_00880, partial [Terriglobales bacterium]|nr:hypothetical protein [Terriglobales bacterium]
DRLEHRDDFEAALVGIQIPDADPNTESNVWPLDGAWHFWNPHPRSPAAWESELDRDFRAQLTTTDPQRRLALYRRIQQIEHQQLPLIPLVSPDVLIAARAGLAGVQAALLPPHWLWDMDHIYWSHPKTP